LIMVDLGDIALELDEFSILVLGGGGGGDSHDQDKDSSWTGSDNGSVSKETEEADSEQHTAPIFSPSLTEPSVFTKACSRELQGHSEAAGGYWGQPLVSAARFAGCQEAPSRRTGRAIIILRTSAEFTFAQFLSKQLPWQKPVPERRSAEAFWQNSWRRTTTL
jgi:hypothetical protein